MGLISVFMGVGFGSVPAGWVTFAGVLTLWAVCPLRGAFAVVWGSLWGVFWYQLLAGMLRGALPGFQWAAPLAAAGGVFAGSLVWAAQQAGVYLEKQAKTGAEWRPAAPPKEAAAFNPYAVLGVAPGASMAEIRARYREQMKLYHPDRVQHLGAELQELAHQKTVEIQRAWEEVLSDEKGCSQLRRRSVNRR